MSRIRLACAGVSVAVLITGGLASAAVTSTAHADPGDTAECPAAFPADDLVVGQEITGLTTAGVYHRDGVLHDSSTVPEEFTGTYNSTIDDPSGDLYVFELQGSRITKSDGSVDAGIWAGMSGSPVYADDGRLIGAVSYSFSGTLGSVYAGVTPADQLYALLDDAAPAQPAKIKLSAKEQQALVSQGLPAAAARRGLHRLMPETTLAGVKAGNEKALEKIAERFGRSAPGVINGTGAQDEEVPIVPGSNFANADSYGTIALYGVGTTTAVCDDVAIAYGHPANWAPYVETAHGATTSFIQEDGAWSYKMANLAAPSGTLIGDHLAGITARLGELPETTTVSSTTTGPKPRQSTSHVPNTDALGYVVANQVYLDTLLTLDQDADGSASLSWSISYEREDGSTGVFTRSGKYAADMWLSDMVTMDVATDVESIVNNPFEEVTVTDVDITEDTSRDYKLLEVGSVDLRKAGKWTKLRQNRVAAVKPGKTMKVRVNLVPSGRKSKASPVSKVVTFKVPKKATKRGYLSITAHGDYYSDEFDYEGSGTSGTSFEAMLAKMAKQPRQDDITIQYTQKVKGAKTKRVTKTWRAPAVTAGWFDFGLKAKKKK